MKPEIVDNCSSNPTFRLLFAACFIFFISCAFNIDAAAATPNLSCPGPADGPGVWMNIWNYPDSAHVEQFCSELKTHGVANCFVQTSRSNTDAVAHPAELNLLTQACHRHGIRVIAWSFTTLSNPKADAERLLAAARFKTGSGETIDGVACDMESNLTAGNIDALGQALRSNLGAAYPLIAIVYSPLNHAPDAARTPWKLLTKYFDIIAPMTYWSGKKQTVDAYTYTCTTIKQIRQAIGKSDVEIQPIGDAMYSKPQDIVLFMKACRENEATGISVYPNQKLTAAQLACLDKYGSYFPPNARFRLAAYRQLCLSGAMPEPPGGDPSSPLSRGRFYQLLVSQSGGGNSGGSATTGGVAIVNGAGNAVTRPGTTGGAVLISEAGAYRYLQERGVAPATKDSAQFLNSPIGVSEALNTIAALISSKRPAAAAPRAAQTAPTAYSAANAAAATTHKHRSGSWLMQSAKAAEPDTTTAASAAAGGVTSRVQPVFLNYIDAAQLVAQARAGLH